MEGGQPSPGRLDRRRCGPGLRVGEWDILDPKFAAAAACASIAEAMDAGWQGDLAFPATILPLAGTYFNLRKTTIYGGSNEVQRNIVAQTVLGS